jgi:hypothetical protein
MENRWAGDRQACSSARCIAPHSIINPNLDAHLGPPHFSRFSLEFHDTRNVTIALIAPQLSSAKHDTRSNDLPRSIMAFLGTVLNTVGALFLTHAYDAHLAGN